MKTNIIDTAPLGDTTLKQRYRKAVQNTKKFNLGLITAKVVKTLNGEKTEFYRKDNNKLLQEWFITTDKNVQFGFVTYKV